MPKCSTCTHEIPKTARACPHCGFLVAQQVAKKLQAIPNPTSTPTPGSTAIPEQFQQQHSLPQQQQHPPPHNFPQQQLPQQQLSQQNLSQQHLQQQHLTQQHLQQQAPPYRAYQQQKAVYHQPYPYQPPMPVMPVSEQKGSDVSALSVASLVLGVIAFITSCVPFFGLPFGIGGIVCGIACKDKKTKGASMALVVTGIVFSILGLMLSLAILAFWLSTASFESFPAEQFIF